MLRYSLIAPLLVATCGCFSSNANVETPPATAASPLAPSPPTPPTPAQAGAPRIEFTPAAKQKIEEFKQADPTQNVIFMTVKFEDEASQTGPIYRFSLGSDPDPAKLELIEVDGMQVALEKSHLSFLNGIRVDWLSVSEEVGGFYFSNPNEKREPTPSESNGDTPPQASPTE